jgi:anti-anti-sigma regulatory factor
MNDTLRPSCRPSRVDLSREVGAVNAQAVGDLLCAAIDRTLDELVVALPGVPFKDSAAVAMMIRVSQYALERGCLVTWNGFRVDPMRAIEHIGDDELMLLDK